MRGTLALAAVIGATLAACGSADPDTEPGTQPAPRPPTVDAVPEGSYFDTVLDQAVGAEESRVGDRFTATVARPLVAADGRVVVPEGARIHGRVTGLVRPERIGDAAAVRLDVERLSFGAASHPLDAEIVDTDVRIEAADERSAERAAVGSVAGAALGAVIDGEAEAALVRGPLGAGPGGIVSLGVGTVAPRLPAGTGMRLRTTRELRLQPGR